MQLTVQEAVKELFYWRRQEGRATNFSALLYELIAKSDWQNRSALRQGFPHEVAAFELWQSSQDEFDFFKAHGFHW